MKKNIIVSGCSWGCGEWTGIGKKKYGVSHKGIEQYLLDDGHQVVNLSEGDNSNLGIAHRLAGWFERHPDHNIDCILVFQTEYTRDMRYDFQIDYHEITSVDTLSGICLSRLYNRLSELAIEHNIPVYLIGGCSDTIWLPNWKNHYPGVDVVCQSMVNLIINNDHRTDTPVYSWYGKDALPTVQRLKSILSVDGINELLQVIDLGFHRHNMLFECPEFFWPDGAHPNRHGHKKLYEFLNQQKLFD